MHIYIYYIFFIHLTDIHSHLKMPNSASNDPVLFSFWRQRTPCWGMSRLFGSVTTKCVHARIFCVILFSAIFEPAKLQFTLFIRVSHRAGNNCSRNFPKKKTENDQNSMEANYVRALSKFHGTGLERSSELDRFGYISIYTYIEYSIFSYLFRPIILEWIRRVSAVIVI